MAASIDAHLVLNFPPFLDALLQKKVESECAADPLFQKMCEAFDEGGARGLLMNQVKTLQPMNSILNPKLLMNQVKTLQPMNSILNPKLLMNQVKTLQPMNSTLNPKLLMNQVKTLQPTNSTNKNCS